MVHQIQMGRHEAGLHRTGQHKVTVHSSSDLGDAFWNIEKGRTIKYGYTPKEIRGTNIRDRITNENGVINYYLWNNNIATLKDNTLTLRDTGWKTPTTKDRLNNILNSKFGYKTRIGQEKYVWYLIVNDKKYQWSDGDNKIDLNNPTKYLKPVEEIKFKEKVKGQREIVSDYIKKWKDGIFKGTITQEELDKLYGIFSERGRYAFYAQTFLQDEKGNWDLEKIKDHWDVLRMDLRWYINRKIQKGEV